MVDAKFSIEELVFEFGVSLDAARDWQLDKVRPPANVIQCLSAMASLEKNSSAAKGMTSSFTTTAKNPSIQSRSIIAAGAEKIGVSLSDKFGGKGSDLSNTIDPITIPVKGNSIVAGVLTDREEMDMLMQSQFNFISLFSGAMGLDLGIEEAGGNLIFANEIDKGAVATIRHNRPEVPVFDGSIKDLAAEHVFEKTGLKKGELSLLCGGPPCQSFSVYGNRAGSHDPRGQLVFEFVRMVGELMPKCFLMENVRGLHSMPLVPQSAVSHTPDYEPWMGKNGSLMETIVRELRVFGYQVDVFLVNSVNYGAPQIRERMFIMGNRIGVANEVLHPTHSNRSEDGLPKFKTLRDAIGEHFLDKIPELMNFSARKIHYLGMVPPGGNWRSLPIDIQKESMGKSWYLKGGRSATWRRLSWDFPSPTVVTMPNHASTSMCHPDLVRALTVGECAAIQEFPSDWVFLGTTAEKYRQIGNAVPVRLGRVAGQAIARMLDAETSVNPSIIGQNCEVNVVHLRPHVRTKRYWYKGEALAGNHSYYETPLPLFG